MRKFIKKIVVFFIVLTALLLIKKEIAPYYISDPIFKAKYDDFSKRKESFNSVIFGSSRLYRHVNVLYLDSLLNDYNLSTYNFSNGATYNPESYFLYDRFLESKDSENIKYAFVELQQLHPYSDSNTKTTKASYWNTIKYLYYSFVYINNSDYDSEKKQELYSCYLRSFFFGLFDFSFLKNIFKSSEIMDIGNNGFYPLEKAMNENDKNDGFKKRWEKLHSDTTLLKNRIESAKIKIESIPSKALNKYHLKFLNSLISRSSQKGVKLIYILPPRLTNNQYNELIPICNSLPPENTIILYSYSVYGDLYTIDNSFDIGHLNSKGANLFTKYISDDFKKINVSAKNTILK